MKYEMIFGDDDFSGQSNELAEVKLWHDYLGPNFVSIKELSRMDLEGTIPRGSAVLAMRRIIAEPKRWTVEDKKAGRLPDVGAEFKARGYVWECVRILNNTILSVSGDSYCGFDINECKPIESPEEKAARLEDEMAELAFDNLMRVGIHSTEDIQRVKNHWRVLYRALLSGDLLVPVKGE